MKIRTGFVSNSSSSSFCVLGVHISETLYDKLLELDACADFCFYNGDEEGYVMGIYASEILEKNNLQQARKIFKDELLKVFGKETYDKIMQNREVNLIYDSYYC